MIGRREFITLLGGAAAWPLAARAQQSRKLPTIGFLGTTSAAAWSPWTATFTQRLRELGWIEGRTIAIEYRWADGRSERFAEIAAEFVRLKVDVILTGGSAAVAAKQATSVIPIVFVLGEPVGTGLVATLARPGGNVTGLRAIYRSIYRGWPCSWAWRARGDLHSVVVEHKQPNGRRQVGMASVGVNARDKFRCGHPTLLGSLDQSFPELILNAHARLVASNDDRALHHHRFHGLSWGFHGFAPEAGSVTHLARRLVGLRMRVPFSSWHSGREPDLRCALNTGFLHHRPQVR
jgi:hypothetical protein